MNAWYLLHCKARQEQRAQQNIENQGYTTCLPQIKRQKIVQGKRIERIEPLFPNYIFIQLDKSTANFNALRSTRGVNGFVRFGGIPATVPGQVMDSILALEQTSEKQDQAQPLFRSGDKVQISDGPFAGLQAIYNMPKGEERCLIFLDMLGQQQSIEIEETALRSEEYS
ncbi:transcription/translation regulatory transformer protein RfaH [Denitrificimonas sp. JX-1]|uniref:Transcription antitermination protein RfaH n=1 Tax=Denitrificimonas halotolerans TaxID=3098930 RepID=A0ABU5GSN8_9GAMM|nr:transcription/translation regulatory transformer protein RfaH [Denitrificimonas sp. JX-1]MDY7219627.1 transcription/translation regulatory transformer protein RfaH [Denitrificimonas sp. JX-1]